MADSLLRGARIRARANPSLLEQVDSFRLDASRKLDPRRKANLAQYFTPAPVAQLMAAMLEPRAPAIHILDAGAGVGTLFAACVAELCSRRNRPEEITVTAYEIDEGLVDYVSRTIRLCRDECERLGIKFTGEVLGTDFVAGAVAMLCGDLFSPSSPRKFNCAILNPPYKKISVTSNARKLLRRLGIETSNIYTGFLATAIQLLDPSGELIAITPRSFCNGLYHRNFRGSLLRAMSLRRLHLFESREEAFRDDDVLQETVIFRAMKVPGKSGTVVVTSSAGPGDPVVSSREISHDQVVCPDDPELFIRIVPDDLGQQVAQQITTLRASLDDLGISVSTGRVVDFRAVHFLRRQAEPGTAPLLYPTNLDRGYVLWPRTGTKKPQAIVITEGSQDLFVPNENYVLVRRFTAKEEKRRVVAAVYQGHLPGAVIGFENHLNYFHRKGRGLDITLAKGLAAYLNSTLVDSYFRQFNGHTQVNATDLRSMRYPTLDQLQGLGTRISPVFPAQGELDEIVRRELGTAAEAD